MEPGDNRWRTAAIERRVGPSALSGSGRGGNRPRTNPEYLSQPLHYKQQVAFRFCCFLRDSRAGSSREGSGLRSISFKKPNRPTFLLLSPLRLTEIKAIYEKLNVAPGISTELKGYCAEKQNQHSSSLRAGVGTQGLGQIQLLPTSVNKV